MKYLCKLFGCPKEREVRVKRHFKIRNHMLGVCRIPYVKIGVSAEAKCNRCGELKSKKIQIENKQQALETRTLYR